MGSGDVLYIIPYGSDDEEFLEHRGVVVREVACENGVDFMCAIYNRILMMSFDKIVATPLFVSFATPKRVELQKAHDPSRQVQQMLRSSRLNYRAKNSCTALIE